MDYKKFIPYLVAGLIFMGISTWYFLPSIQGKQIKQHDIVSYKAASKEARDYREATGEEPLWTGRMFSGMPTFFITFASDGNLIGKIEPLFKGFVSGPIGYFFLIMLGFFFLLRVMGVQHWLSVVGAIFFGFSSYFIILVDAGHNTKLSAIAFMAPVLGSVILAYRKNIWIGAVLTALFTSLEIYSNHIQITYYLFIVLVFYIFSEAIKHFIEKRFAHFLKISSILVISAVIGVLPNTTKLWTIYDASKETIRGGNTELTPLNPENDNLKKNGGLDKDYAYKWSYGVKETVTLLIPKAFGGASTESLDTKSETYKALKKAGVPSRQAQQYVTQGMPTYWGDQPFTSGPTFVGGISVFLFLLGLLILDRRDKYWILGATVLAILLSWGKNFQWFSDLFFDYAPMYNKFRAPSMFLVVAELLIPLGGILALSKVIKVVNGEQFNGSLIVNLVSKWLPKYEGAKSKLKLSLMISLYLIAAVCLFFAFFGEVFFDFSTARDIQFAQQLKSSGFPDFSANAVLEALREDRINMFTSGVWQALFLIALVSGAIYLFFKNTIKKEFLIGIVGILGTYELVSLDLDYLNHDDFVSERSYKDQFSTTPADDQILLDKNYYRVLNLSVNTFNDAITSYHHNSIGGYSAAKLQRYQDLIERQISKNNQAVWSMLNTKYIIQQPSQASRFNNNGPLWNVKNINWVEGADEEMKSLNDFNPLADVFIDKRYQETYTDWTIKYDSTAQLLLEEYDPKHMKYSVNCSSDQIIVFSEIFYKGNEDWKAYIDGEYVDHFRCNYVLRGLKVPAGNHKVEFKFEPHTFYTGETISYTGSFLMILFIGFVAFKERKSFQKV